MFLISLMLILSTLMFLTINHPLMMVIMLIIISTLTAMKLGTLYSTFWLSYMLFLVLVGGMLIIFIYMTSIAPNEKFKMNNKIFISIIMVFPLWFMNDFYTNYMYMNNLLMKANEMMMMKYINFPNVFLPTMMILYLILTLIVVVKITKINMGPLRQKY
uniref:NADH-ubiquinone oxidoreductase chain 6 n=1 Tax=Stegobium paniceum TaxID=295656 RepID=A0A343C0X9_STEPN|nr:NADH dehydrogenase subunit 6 [Stegobium paniceum]ARH10880.1 NADH dehydrogenase subunit 6 [Stegobium paniceum]QCI56379.1 NADH dehydrogenase subunit 6 [Stegobium paniceum]QDH12152.1 NADH dehydrogenase subunit 6 [Stegobium paniceum]